MRSTQRFVVYWNTARLIFDRYRTWKGLPFFSDSLRLVRPTVQWLIYLRWRFNRLRHFAKKSLKQCNSHASRIYAASKSSDMGRSAEGFARLREFPKTLGAVDGKQHCNCKA
uniref:Uncharacterized protein n=1 Tax=Ditylenchus dipsaci TaxID=166011 RepID=A0A915DFD5_9BILA